VDVHPRTYLNIIYFLLCCELLHRKSSMHGQRLSQKRDLIGVSIVHSEFVLKYLSSLDELQVPDLSLDSYPASTT